MLLTIEERQKFIEWLKQNIESSEAIQNQFDKLNLPKTVVDTLTHKEETERAAYKIVLKVLQSIESQEL